MSAPQIVDLVVVILIALFAIIGLMKGFIRSLVSTFGTFFAILFAVLVCGAVVTFLETKYQAVTFFGNSISGWVNNLLGTSADKTVAEVTEASFIESGVSGWIAKLILQLKGTEGLDPALTVSQVACSMFGYYISATISIIGLFIIFKILIFIISDLLLKHVVVGALKTVDKVLGFVVGIVSGVIVVQSVLTLIGGIPLDFFVQINGYVSESSFTKFLMSFNVVQAILDSNILAYVTNLFTHPAP